MQAPKLPRELRVCGIQSNGLAQYQIGYWRRYGRLFVQAGTPVVLEEQDLVPLVRGIVDARKVLRALKGDRAT